MSSSVLDHAKHQNLILLLYTEILPYATVAPKGITLPLFLKECKKLSIHANWYKKYWNKNQKCGNDTINIYIGKCSRNVKYFTRYLRNAFAHCQVTENNGIICAYCKNTAKFRGKCNGRKIFELRISEKKLIDLLTFIRNNKS